MSIWKQSLSYHNLVLIIKMNLSSDSDTDGSEHELGYYVKNKVKLMKEVLKLIKPKKIKSMAPDCMKVNQISYNFYIK